MRPLLLVSLLLVTANAYADRIPLGSVGGQDLFLLDLGPGRAEAISDNGLVTGQTQNGQAFLWSSGIRGELDMPGYYTSVGLAVNNAGTIVGRAASFNGAPIGAAFSYDAAATIEQLGPDESTARAINDAGQIVGDYGDRRAVLWNNNFTDLGTFGGPWSAAMDIAADGAIVGTATNRRIEDRAFLLVPEDTNADGDPDLWVRDDDSDGVNDLLIDIGRGLARAVNDNGTVVGFDNGGYTWDAANGRQLLESDSDPLDINNSGQIVGTVRDLAGDEAFLHQDGSRLTLNTLLPNGTDWDLTSATAINAQGWIVGHGMRNGERHAFVIVPEPGGLAVLLLLGLFSSRRF